MSSILSITITAVIALVIIATFGIYASKLSRTFKINAYRIIFIPLLAIAALFCVFGFLGSGEASTLFQQWLWRFIYASIGSACLFGIARLIKNKRS